MLRGRSSARTGRSAGHRGSAKQSEGHGPGRSGRQGLRAGQGRAGQDRTGQDRTGQGRAGQDRTGRMGGRAGGRASGMWMNSTGLGELRYGSDRMAGYQITATRHQPCSRMCTGRPREGDITEFIAPRRAPCAVQRARRYGRSHDTEHLQRSPERGDERRDAGTTLKLGGGEASFLAA